jgi:hypothetical protein
MDRMHREPAGEASPNQLTAGIIRGGAPYAIFGSAMDILIKFHGREGLSQDCLSKYDKLYAKKTGIVDLKDGSLIME